MDGETKVGCLNLLFEIPYVSWIFLLGPPALVIIGLESLLHINMAVSDWLIFLLSVLLLVWLRFLEKRVGIRMTLPILPIPWFLVAWAGVGLGLLVIIVGLFS